VLVLADSLDLVVRTANARDALAAVFGKPYSRKTPWPRETKPVSDSARTAVMAGPDDRR
jgi:hypothetical protein